MFNNRDHSDNDSQASTSASTSSGFGISTGSSSKRTATPFRSPPSRDRSRSPFSPVAHCQSTPVGMCIMMI